MAPDYHIIIKYFRNESDSSERNIVETWIKASNENEKLFDELKNSWENADKSLEQINPDFEKAWRNIQIHTGIKNSEAKQISLKVSFRNYLKIAAFIIVLMGIGVVLKFYFFNTQVFKVETALNNSKREIKLADGTIVVLNKNSQVSFPEKFVGKREILLIGEAFFKVAKDKAHPFIIHAAGTITKVLGTSFDVKVNNSGLVYVSVLTGKVTFQSETKLKKTLHLIKGDQGMFDPKSGELVKKQISDENFLSWQTGIISFKNQNLSEAVKVLSEYYSKKIIVQPSIQNRLITVTLDNQQLDEALKIMALTLNISIENSTEQITLKTINRN